MRTSLKNAQRHCQATWRFQDSKLLTKCKETFFNPVYLLLFYTLFVCGIYHCKAELFLFKMIPHLQWLHIAGLSNVPKLAILCYCVNINQIDTVTQTSKTTY